MRRVVKHLECPAGELEAYIVSGVGNSDADLGRSCTEGRRPCGALTSRARASPAEGAAASEPWPTVAIWPVCDFSRKVRNLHFWEVFLFLFCFVCFLRVIN